MFKLFLDAKIFLYSNQVESEVELLCSGAFLADLGCACGGTERKVVLSWNKGYSSTTSLLALVLFQI